MKKIILMLGVMLSIFLCVSYAVAIPQTTSNTMIDSYRNVERTGWYPGCLIFELGAFFTGIGMALNMMSFGTLGNGLLILGIIIQYIGDGISTLFGYG